MLLGIAGVSGAGKSYYKRRITEKLGFLALTIVTTRQPRSDDKSGEKIYVSSDEFEKMRETGEIAFGKKYCGALYGYLRDELSSSKNLVCEFPYSFFDEFVRTCPNFRSIYLFPREISTAKAHLCERKLDPAVEAFRLAEIDEHLANLDAEPKLLAAYDRILYNDYDAESEARMLNCVRELMRIK